MGVFLLIGLLGVDCLRGGRGADRLFGNQGNDRITGGSNADRIFTAAEEEFGVEIPDEDLPTGRYKQQISPRLGVAYPISDRDVLSFHYGWTFQTPPRNFVFENRGSHDTSVSVPFKGS